MALLGVRAVLAACMLLCSLQPALADDTKPQAAARTYLGVQGLLALGVHSDVAGRQYGLGGGPLFQFLFVPSRRFALHVEGFPVVSIPQRASAYYGAATPSLGIFIGTVRVAVDKDARYWLGIGTTIVNQRTPLPNISQVASSRLAGGRYEFYAHVPTHGLRFVEFQGGVTPRLHGADHYLYSDGVTPAVNKDEAAAEEDISLALGIQHANSAILIGVRSINFSAVYTKTGLAADRNNAAGVMVEWRRYLSP